MECIVRNNLFVGIYPCELASEDKNGLHYET